jgi:hypothetical protein
VRLPCLGLASDHVPQELCVKIRRLIDKHGRPQLIRGDVVALKQSLRMTDTLVIKKGRTGTVRYVTKRNSVWVNFNPNTRSEVRIPRYMLILWKSPLDQLAAI